MKSALILIDIQNDYFPGGKYELFHSEQALTCVERALKEYRSRELPIYFIQHVNLKQDAAFFSPNTKGVEIHQTITPRSDEKVLVKHYPDAFIETGLSDELQKQGISQLVICGMMSQMCIDTTVRAAQSYGLSVTLLSDACAAKELVWKDKVISADTVHNVIMASLDGTFASVVQTEEFLANIENRADE